MTADSLDGGAEPSSVPKAGGDGMINLDGMEATKWHSWW